MQDLNSLLPAGSGWTLNSAYGINDSGQITGYGTNPAGQLDAFVISLPEPASLSLIGLGAMALLRRRPRGRKS